MLYLLSMFTAVPQIANQASTVAPTIPQNQTEVPQLQYTLHVEDSEDDIGPFSSPQFAGSGKKRLEGFTISVVSGQVDLEYTAHLEGQHDDTAAVKMGSFIGTRGESRRLEGFTINLKGESAELYNIHYLCTVEGQINSPALKNGEFCGTRDQSLNLYGFLVYITKKYLKTQ